MDWVDEAVIEGLSRLTTRLACEERQVVFSGLALDRIVRRELEGRCAGAVIFVDLDTALEACEDSLLRGHRVGQNGHAIVHTGLSVAQLDVARDLDAAELRYLESLMTRHRLRGRADLCPRRRGERRLFPHRRRSERPPVFRPDDVSAPGGVRAGTVFGEVAIIDGGTRSADVWAETDVEFLTLPVEQFNRLAVENPPLKIKLLQHLLRILATRLPRANDLIGQLSD